MLIFSIPFDISLIKQHECGNGETFEWEIVHCMEFDRTKFWVVQELVKNCLHSLDVKHNMNILKCVCVHRNLRKINYFLTSCFTSNYIKWFEYENREVRNYSGTRLYFLSVCFKDYFFIILRSIRCVKKLLPTVPLLLKWSLASDCGFQGSRKIQSSSSQFCIEWLI